MDDSDGTVPASHSLRSGRVLITGATGFAGSFLVEQYAARGWKVCGTYRDSREDRSWLPRGVDLYQLDLREPHEVRRVVRDSCPDVVHHLAAQSSVTVSWQDPMATLTDNSLAQYNLFEAALEYCPKARILVVGSCDEYGNVTVENNPVTESQALRPANPYALSKVTQDLMGGLYAETRGMSVVRVRPFLQIGPRRSDVFVAGTFARQIAEIELGIREPILEVGNVDLSRDFTDVRDVTRAYAMAAEMGQIGDVYNIASGVGHTLRDLLQSMLAATSIQVTVRQDPSRVRPGEMPLLIGDSSKLRKLTGWAPDISFERSAANTLEYWRHRTRSAVVQRGLV